MILYVALTPQLVSGIVGLFVAGGFFIMIYGCSFFIGRLLLL